MKEKDLEKNLDNLIIDGLIKEAEQDNADFEAAMRKMSDEMFVELIYDEYEYEPAYASNFANRACEMADTYDAFMDGAYLCFSEKPRAPFQPIVTKKSKWQVFRPWITSAVAAAAVVLIILIPSVNAVNGKLCDSALYVSTDYITSSRSATEINGLREVQLKAKLPELEKRYKDCIREEGTFTYYTDDLKETGWDLTLAYLRLHKKGDAVKVLKVLSENFNGTPFGNHCRKLLDQLR